MTEVFWIIVCLILTALAFLTYGFFYKRMVVKKWDIIKIQRLYQSDKLSPELFSIYYENLTKRITNFNKLIIGSLVVTFIVVLLILKIIHAESGLPIITAIVGYILAENASNTKRFFKQENKEEERK